MEVVHAADPAGAEPSSATAGTLSERVEAFRRRAIQDALRAEGGSIAAAARRLGMDRSNLHHVIRRLGIAT